MFLWLSNSASNEPKNLSVLPVTEPELRATPLLSGEQKCQVTRSKNHSKLKRKWAESTVTAFATSVAVIDTDNYNPNLRDVNHQLLNRPLVPNKTRLQRVL